MIKETNQMEIDNKTSKIVTLDLGKIDYNGQGRKTNKAEVEVGFRFLDRNKESYFTVTGDIWNMRHTDILRGGAGTPQFLLEEFFPHNATLRRVVQLADKWHLTDFSSIPKTTMAEIIDLMEEIEDFNGDLRNL